MCQLLVFCLGMSVVEVPSLRWSWAQCVSLPAEKRPDTCETDAPKTIQELAWTSPIWYRPAAMEVTSATARSSSQLR